MERIRNLFEKKWFTCVLLVLGAVGVGVVSLAFAATSNRWNMMESYFKRPLLLLLNLLPGVLLCLFLWFLCNRAVVAYGVSSVAVFGFTLANWYKLQFRNDPLMFGDLFLAKEAGNMLGRYSLFLTPSLVIAILLILGGGVCLFFCGRGRFRPGWRRFALAGAVLLAAVPLSFLYTDNTVYNKHTQNPDYVNSWSATQVYTSKGFVYPFLHSVTSAFHTPPEGYNKAEAQAVLANYEDADIPEEKKVDLIGVMLEGFNDFSKYEQIQFHQDVYAAYHELEREAVSGNLVTSIFAGGTVKTERSFLTGYALQSSFRGRTNSYAWYLADQGYTVTGSHPCYEWFYNRLNINPNLGFESYLFQEDHYGALAPEGTIAKDEILLPELNRLYEEAKAESDRPYFSFSVTYQGHGPYNTGENQWGENYVKPGVYSQESENILNNYFGSLKSTGEELRSFVDFYRNRENPVVIVLFGDHNPWLGDDNSVYRELGIDLDNSQETGFLNYYGTRYLIWANDAAKKALGNDFQGQGPDLSPNYLMNEVFGQCGWEGPAYMQYLSGLREELPVLHATGACITKDGELLSEPEGGAKELLDEFYRVEYYMQDNFQYQDVAEQRKAAEKAAG